MKALDPWEMPLGGTALVEASAGTGKTYTLTTLYVRLLVEQGLHPSEILVVTYTNAATAELRERVRQRIEAVLEQGALAAADAPLPEAPAARREAEAMRRLAAAATARADGNPLLRAQADFDEAAIFTIHGFCQRTLQENAFESGIPFDVELVEQSKPIEEALANDLFHRLIDEEPPDFARWLLDGEGKRWLFGPDSLRRHLLGRLGADETMPIVPETGEEGRVEALAERTRELVEARRRFAREWPGQGESIAALLADTDGLDKKSYSKRNVPNWIGKLDAFSSEVEALGDDARAIAALQSPAPLLRFRPAVLAGCMKAGKPPPAHPAFTLAEALHAATEARQDALDARALFLRKEVVRRGREAARRRREENHLFFFDDLLSELRRALAGEAGERLRGLLRDRYRFALIDEFQDTDPVQYDIFRRVWHEEKAATRRGMVLIGDPKQAIYAFRGADVFTYLDARKTAGDAVFGLDTNYRSDPGLIEAVNALFSAPDSAFREDRIAFAPVQSRPDFEASFVPGEGPVAAFRILLAEREALARATGEPVEDGKPMAIRYGRTLALDAVATDVVRRLQSGARLGERSLVPSDIAILCRRKAELQRMRERLEARGIPCVDRGEANVFDTREAWEFSCVLRAMNRPTDAAVLRGALATGAHGLDARAIAALEDEAPELAACSERYAEYGRVGARSGFAQAFEAWRIGERVGPTLLAYADGDRRITNWLHLAELLQRYASEHDPSPTGLQDALDQAIASESARSLFGSDASLLRLERDDEAVSLVTLHASKGLEYPIVYLPCLWEGGRTIPDPAKKKSEKTDVPGERKRDTKENPPVLYQDPATRRRTLDLDAGPEVRQARDEEEFAEQLRLLYVGLTRARHQCVVAWGGFGENHGQAALAWLLQGEKADALDAPAVRSETRSYGDAEWRALWEQVALRAGPGALSIEALDFESDLRWTPTPEARPALVHEPVSRRFGDRFRTTSFSGLTREAHRAYTPHALAEGPADVLGRDRDLGASSKHDAPLDETPPDLAAEMESFPRGAEAGTFLHAVIETTDLAALAAEPEAGPAQQARLEKIEAELRKHRMDPERAEQALHVIRAVATTPLRIDPEPFRLGDVSPGALLPEMEFTLAARAPRSASRPAFDPASLSGLLATAPEGSPLQRYAERAGRLGFARLQGFLRGFIDAVFHDGERYFLVDYKSNHLGDHQRDYLPEALVEPMVEHDYVLQALVYSVALDRHLARCLADYDYDRDFGGAYYLFLRGFAPTHAPRCGVFHDRPPRAIVEGFAALLGLDRGGES